RAHTCPLPSERRGTKLGIDALPASVCAEGGGAAEMLGTGARVGSQPANARNTRIREREARKSQSARCQGRRGLVVLRRADMEGACAHGSRGGNRRPKVFVVSPTGPRS